MHPIAHQLGRITRMTVERGEFGPDDFKAILTQLASLAKDVLGQSHLVDARQQLARYKEREAVQGWAPL